MTNYKRNQINCPCVSLETSDNTFQLSIFILFGKKLKKGKGKKIIDLKSCKNKVKLQIWSHNIVLFEVSVFKHNFNLVL